jgi:NADH-quinone oxidoreductase subunit M
VLTLAVIGILYGALLAVGQTDMKRFVAYTSIAHFGFIALGIFSFSTQALAGRRALHGQPRASPPGCCS